MVLVQIWFDPADLPAEWLASQEECQKSFCAADQNIKSAQVTWNNTGCTGYAFLVVTAMPADGRYGGVMPDQVSTTFPKDGS
jgi:hypothetical protein